MAVKDISLKLENHLPDQNTRNQRDEALKKACRDFESVFTYQLLKSMRSTIDKCDLFHGGQGEEIYESLLDQELSKKIAGGGSNSLSEFLYRQLKRKGSTEFQGPDTGITRESPESSSSFQWPVRSRITSEFGKRKDPFTGESRFHRGIDLAATEGTPVEACREGRVILSEYQKGYGNVVVLDHGQGVTTLYAHNRENFVKEGEWIKKGAPVAEVGSTGRSTGPHLHFEIRRHGRHLDPLEFLEEGSVVAKGQNLVFHPIDR